jgi:hypothetical protein
MIGAGFARLLRVESSCRFCYHLLRWQGAGGGRPGSGENQAAQLETRTRLERAGHPQWPYREFPGKSRLWRSLWRRNGYRPVYEPWVDEAGSNRSFVSPQAGEINDYELQNGERIHPRQR